jgi:hypothetical protein
VARSPPLPPAPGPLERDHDIASLESLDAFLDRTMQGGSFLIVQVIATAS